DPFTIIRNLGGQPITGTFDQLADGSLLTLNELVFKISYRGGTGHDVVLTVVQTSAPPPESPEPYVRHLYLDLLGRPVDPSGLGPGTGPGRVALQRRLGGAEQQGITPGLVEGLVQGFLEP